MKQETTAKVGGIVASVLVAALPAHLQAQPAGSNLTVQQDLELGVLPQDAAVTVNPTDAGAARIRIRITGSAPCSCYPVEIEFLELPNTLSSQEGDTVDLSYNASSARIWEADDPTNFEEFDPSSETGLFPLDSFPAFLELGTSVTVPADAPPSLYEAEAELQVTRYSCDPPDCYPFYTNTTDVTVTLEVQSRLVVEAEVNTIDLGMLLHGMEVIVPADGTGDVEPASFVVTGPQSLDYLLTVITHDLEHETEPDTIPLEFTSGIVGTEPGAGDSFESGHLVSSEDHEGGPLHVRCGFQVTVPDGVSQGWYRGDIILSVEVLLG